MATIIFNVENDQWMKKECSMMKGIAAVKEMKNKDITKSKGYQEVLDDMKTEHIYHAGNADDRCKQVLG